MLDNILSTLGLALKAGKAEVGEEPVGAATRAKKARVVLLAQDAAASSVRRAMSFAQGGNCLCLTLPADKDALGRALGRTSVAMCAVTEIGFAGAIVKKLAAIDGEKYGAAAAQLDVKAQRAMERRAEQLRHEKNLRQGKHRVHSDKPPEPPAASPEEPKRRTKPPESGKPGRGGGRGDGTRRKTARRPENRFAGSLPVKRGKGSVRKKQQES